MECGSLACCFILAYDCLLDRDKVRKEELLTKQRLTRLVPKLRKGKLVHSDKEEGTWRQRIVINANDLLHEPPNDWSLAG